MSFLLRAVVAFAVCVGTDAARRARPSLRPASSLRDTHAFEPVPPFKHRDFIGGILESEGKRVGVELGVLEGAFAEATFKGWTSVESYTFVDLWGSGLVNYADANKGDQAKHDERMAKAMAVTAPWSSKRHVCRNFTTACASTFEDHSLHFVYIDARHSRKAVLEDIAAYWNKLAHGGLLCGHDFVDCASAARSSQDWCLEEDGSRDLTGGAVQGAVMEWAQLHKRQIQLGYRESDWNSWCMRR